MVDADLAELVDDHRGVAEPGVADEPVQQRRLAAAEKPGDDEDRDHARLVVPSRSAIQSADWVRWR